MDSFSGSHRSLVAKDGACGIEGDGVAPGQSGLRGENPEHAGEMRGLAGFFRQAGSQRRLDFPPPGLKRQLAERDYLIRPVMAENGEEMRELLPPEAEGALPPGFDGRHRGIQPLGALLKHALGEAE